MKSLFKNTLSLSLALLAFSGVAQMKVGNNTKVLQAGALFEVEGSNINPNRKFVIPTVGVAAGTSTDDVLVIDANHIVKYIKRADFGGNYTAGPGIKITNNTISLGDITSPITVGGSSTLTIAAPVTIQKLTLNPIDYGTPGDFLIIGSDGVVKKVAPPDAGFVPQTLTKPVTIAGSSTLTIAAPVTIQNLTLNPLESATPGEFLIIDGAGKVKKTNSSPLTGAFNGLTVDAGRVRLGGALTIGVTDVTGDINQTLNFKGANFTATNSEIGSKGEISFRGDGIIRVSGKGYTYGNTTTLQGSSLTVPTNLATIPYIQVGWDPAIDAGGNVNAMQQGKICRDCSRDTGASFTNGAQSTDALATLDIIGFYPFMKATNKIETDAGRVVTIHDRLEIIDTPSAGRTYGSTAYAENPGYFLMLSGGSSAEDSKGAAVIRKTATGFSDRRLKKDISTLPSSDMLAKVLSLNPVSYHWNNLEMGNSRELHYGFIAQEVEAVSSDLIIQFDTKREKWADGTDFKGVKYQEIIPLLTASIQEQQKQIEALKLQISELKSALEGLKK